MQVSRVAAAVALVASAVWMGGIVTLGAVVAPIVFRVVSAPTSADAMTLVFRRFDAVAMSSAAVVLLMEALRAAPRVRPPRRAGGQRLDLARLLAASFGAALAIWQGVSLSPRIEALHRGGAIRGLGEAGLELEAVHKLAEAVGKTEVMAVIAVIILYAFTVHGDSKVD